jgi:hypothetical protein
MSPLLLGYCYPSQKVIFYLYILFVFHLISYNDLHEGNQKELRGAIIVGLGFEEIVGIKNQAGA